MVPRPSRTVEVEQEAFSRCVKETGYIRNRGQRSKGAKILRGRRRYRHAFCLIDVMGAALPGANFLFAE
jgi:hypothetical protein